jgi:formylglycine-generating enzyme required for sulfatase activity
MSAVLAGCAGVTAGQGPGSEFRDCPDCPIMTVIPAGQFTMGSLPGETQRRGWPANTGGNERPMHEVTISAPFALGKYEVTRGQFAAFVAATGYQATGGCMQFVRGGIGVVNRPENSWRNPGFEQRDDEPVLCASWLDARAYVDWLANSSGQPYRLPSEAEWEYAARAGNPGPRWWGELANSACAYANVADLATARAFNWEPNPAEIHMCDDGEAQIAPVGRYPPNPFGLHDMLGNVWEMVEDCWNPGYRGRPRDARPWLAGNCQRRIQRGGSWLNDSWRVRSGTRFWIGAGDRAVNLGFRVARSLPP